MRDVEQLRQTIERQRLSRRDVLRRSIALGLSAPVVASLLAACGGDSDSEDEEGNGGDAGEVGGTEIESEPTATAAATGANGSSPTETSAGEPEVTEAESGAGSERGGHGELRLLWWQAPTILNTHYSHGSKDDAASRPILEPLLDVKDDGSLYPVLAAEVPSLTNGGLSQDGLTVTIKLREGVKWHDGEDFNAEDVKFTYDWVASEGNVTTTSSDYQNIQNVEIIDDYTVRLTFIDVNPAWMNSMIGRIIPEHIMKDFMGAKGPDAPFNLNPIGTGPYKVKEFKPGDRVSYEINLDYWDPGKPHFDTVEMTGGGDPTSAARAAIQTGEVDYAWNLQVESTVLTQIAEQGEFGELLAPEGVSMERVAVQFADPRTEIDGAYAEPSTPHPWQTDDAVRKAYALLIDRDTMAEELYGPTGVATGRWLIAPEKFLSDSASYEFNPEKAAQVLDEAGWVVDDGVRAKDGVSIDIVLQTTVNSLRQKEQEIIKQAFESVGMPVEIAAIDAGVFFSTDAGNPDNLIHFYADLQIHGAPLKRPYPIEYMAFLTSANPSEDIAQKSNSWSGPNFSRWVNEEYNEAYLAAKTELDEDKQAELFIKMNDLIIENVAAIPLVQRADVSAKAKTLDIGEHSRWATDLYNIADWRRIST